MPDEYDDSGTTWVPNLHELNMQHDLQQHSVSMDLGARYGGRTFSNLVKGPLTDRKIDDYAERGWYSEAFQEARRELWRAVRQNEHAWNDEALLTAYAPDIGSPQRFNHYIERGYSLSNWHVITV